MSWAVALPSTLLPRLGNKLNGDNDGGDGKEEAYVVDR